jgi:hypothetical protein
MLGFNFCFLLMGYSKTSSGFLTLLSIGLYLFLPARSNSTTLLNLGTTRFSFVRKYSDWLARFIAFGSLNTSSYYYTAIFSCTSCYILGTTFKS